MSAKQRAKRTESARGRGRKAPVQAATTAAILGSVAAVAFNGHRGPPPRQWAEQYRRLLTLRDRLQTERSGLALAACQPLESYSMSMADAATDEFDHVLALSELSAEQDALYEIEEALKRIENGTYGVCQLSGKPIPKARLKALPWTRFAGEVERQLELQGALPRAHLGELRSVAELAGDKLGEAETGEERTEAPPSDETLSELPFAPGASISQPPTKAPSRKFAPLKARRKKPH